jgi:outer membrane protein TolC
LTDESAQALALSQRLDVVASLAVVEANKKDLSAQERSRIRDLGIGVVVQRTQNELRSLGLQNSIPIFDFNQAQIAKSGSLGRAALATAESVFQRAIMEARVGLGEARAAQALALDYRQGALPLARTNFERANRALHDGIVDVNTLLGTLETLADDEQSANDLDLLAVAARIELERAVGGSMTSTPVPREPDPTPAADAPGP